jgi:hypothetical protein
MFASGGEPKMSPTDINAVVNAHAKELMTIPGVVGVYVGVMDDQKTPCIKIMLTQRTPTNERMIPRQIGGFPVIAEVTGEIRPLEKH